MNTMRLPLAMLLAGGLCAAASGCRSNTQKIETELRARENDVRDLREDLDRCEAYNRASQMELRAMRGEPVGPATPEGPAPVYPVRSLTLGRQTGGREVDGGTGDGALQVVLEPRDAEGQSVKIPNVSAIIQVVEITPEGIKQPLSTWDIPAEQLRNHWRTGLLTTGYVLVLPWKETPTVDRLRVTATLRMPDGRVYEADKDVTIRLPPGGKRRVAPPPPADGPVLPLPRPIDPANPGVKRDKTPAPTLVSRKPWWDVRVVKPVPPEPAVRIGTPLPLP
jgi:hypothetical protein